MLRKRKNAEASASATLRDKLQRPMMSLAINASDDDLPWLDSPYVGRQHVDAKTITQLRAVCATVVAGTDLPEEIVQLARTGCFSQPSQTAPGSDLSRPTAAVLQQESTSHPTRYAYKPHKELKEVLTYAAKPHPQHLSHKKPQYPDYANYGRRGEPSTSRAATSTQPSAVCNSNARQRSGISSTASGADNKGGRGGSAIADLRPRNGAVKLLGMSKHCNEVASVLGTSSHQSATPHSVTLGGYQTAEAAKKAGSSMGHSRKRSWREGIKDYIRPSSAASSRPPSRSQQWSRPSSALGDDSPSSGRGWKSWGRSGRDSLTENRVDSAIQSNRVSQQTTSTEPLRETNLNRKKLPPLPSLDSWQEPASADTHIAALMSKQRAGARSQPTLTESYLIAVPPASDPIYQIAPVAARPCTLENTGRASPAKHSKRRQKVDSCNSDASPCDASTFAASITPQLGHSSRASYAQTPATISDGSAVRASPGSSVSEQTPVGVVPLRGVRGEAPVSGPHTDLTGRLGRQGRSVDDDSITALPSVPTPKISSPTVLHKESGDHDGSTRKLSASFRKILRSFRVGMLAENTAQVIEVPVRDQKSGGETRTEEVHWMTSMEAQGVKRGMICSNEGARVPVARG